MCVLGLYQCEHVFRYLYEVCVSGYLWKGNFRGKSVDCCHFSGIVCECDKAFVALIVLYGWTDVVSVQSMGCED